MLAIGLVILAACGEAPRPGAPAPAPTEPVAIGAEGVPGAAGQPLGPITPQSDVSFEVRTNAAIEQLVGLLLDPTFVDWDAVREAYEASPAPVGNAVPPSVAAVMRTAATGPLGADYVERFGSRDWLNARALNAITGTGRFTGSSDTERAAALTDLLTIELPLVQALVAAEAGERLTEAGDLDPRFGAPHEWDRLWVIVQGAAPLGDALTDSTVAAIVAGATAGREGDDAAARTAHDTVRVALLHTALDAIAESEATRAMAFLRGVEPLLARIDPAGTTHLADLIESDEPPDPEVVRSAVTALADRGGIEAPPALVES